jgi:hypothetical protein
MTRPGLQSNHRLPRQHLSQAMSPTQTLESLSSMSLDLLSSLLSLTLSPHSHRQCKRICSPELKHLFCHPQLMSMNLLFTDLVTDETFSFLPPVPPPPLENVPLAKHDRYSPYLSLLFGQPASSASLLTTLPSTSPPVSSPSLCSLQSLSIGMSSITDITLYRIASFSTNLHELHLQWCSQLTDYGIHVLVTNCHSLQILNLKSCSQLTDQALQSIGSECHQMKHLDISWCSEFTDQGLLHLVSEEETQSHCPQLTQLCLSWCPLITASSLMVLFHHLIHLRSVDLSGCVGVTSDCVARIQQKRGDVIINC